MTNQDPDALIPRPHTDPDDLTPDLERELDAAYMAAITSAPRDPLRAEDPWRINTLDAATWASRKAATAERRLEQIKAWRKAEEARIAQVFDRMAAEPQNTLDFMTAALADYLQREITAGNLGDKKSLPLMGGTIKLTAARKIPTIKDEAAFITWAKATRPDLIRTTEAVDKNALNQAATLAEDGIVTIDGEIIETLEWTAEPDKASFKRANDR